MKESGYEKYYIFAGYRYTSQIISHAVRLYHRFTLSFRDIEELLAARDIAVSYETIRNWCEKVTQRAASRPNQDSHG